MLFDTKTVPTRKELLTDLVAFGVTVVAAVFLDWEAADIVWASWITSLLTGLSFFLIMSVKMLWDYAMRPPHASANEGEKSREELVERSGVREKRATDEPSPMDANPGCLCLLVGGGMALLAWLAGPGLVRIGLIVLIGVDVVAFVVAILAPRGWFGVNLNSPAARALFFFPTSLFFLFFFLVHFGGFHGGHAVFLSFIVPLEAEFAEFTFSAAGVPVGIGAFLGALVFAYWPYILSVGVKNLGPYRAALKERNKQGDNMMLPYKNVIRIHLLIFVLIPLAALGSGILLTVTVLMFFFFPVESVAAWYRNR